MRELCNIYTAITSYPLTMDELKRYGVTLLFCLPLSVNLDDAESFLVTVSGWDKVLRTNDIMFEMLNDALGKRGRAWSCSCAGHYFAEV